MAMLTCGLFLLAQPEARPHNAEQGRIVTSVETTFKALSTNDPALLHSVAEPDFYLFDAGVKMDAPSIMALLQQMRASGTHFEWHVTDPDVHILGEPHGSLM